MPRFPNVPTAIEKEIDTLIESEGPAGFAVQLEQAWELLPEPRLEWDYYPQVLSQAGCSAGVKRGDWDLAERWLARGRAAHAATGDHDDVSDIPMDGWEARIKVARGDSDAFDYCQGLLAKHGPRFFSGPKDAAILALLQSHS